MHFIIVINSHLIFNSISYILVLTYFINIKIEFIKTNIIKLVQYWKNHYLTIYNDSLLMNYNYWLVLILIIFQ